MKRFISIGPPYSNVYVIDVSPEELLVYESVKAKKRPLFELAREKGSFIEAVKELVSQNKKDK